MLLLLLMLLLLRALVFLFLRAKAQALGGKAQDPRAQAQARAQRDADNPDAWRFISRHVLPYLKELGATDADIKTLMIDNPRRYIEGAFQV